MAKLQEKEVLDRFKKEVIFLDDTRLRLISKYKLTSGSHLLIGKDGGVKRRQEGALDLKEFFTLINTMPMRMQERKRGKSDEK